MMLVRYPIHGVSQRTIEAGCEVLYRKIPEAFEPEYRVLIAQMFRRMMMEESASPTLAPVARAKPVARKYRNSIDARLARLRGHS